MPPTAPPPISHLSYPRPRPQALYWLQYQIFIYLNYVAINGADGTLIISNSLSFPIITSSDVSSNFWFYT